MSERPQEPLRGAAGKRTLLALAALVASTGCGGAPAPEPEDDPSRILAGILATCGRAVRDVQLRRAGETTWEPAAAGVLFRAGDELRTGPRSTARIAFLAGGTLELDESTAVLVDVQPRDGAAGAGTLRSAPRDGGGESRVAVKAGVVRGTLPRPGPLGRAAGLVVLSQDGSAVRIAARPGAERTAFRLVRQEIGTELAVLRGSASVNGANGETSLDAGHFAVARRGELGEPALLIAPPDRLGADDERVHFVPGAAVRLRWAEVPGATGYRVQIARDPAFVEVEAADVVDRTEYAFRPAARAAYSWRVAARDVSGGFGEYGPARRVHLEEQAPRDLLVRPADGAVVRTPGDAGRVVLEWDPSGETRTYRVVLSRSPDLLVAPAVTLDVSGLRATVELASPGEYWWGVYVDAGAGPLPLFTSPRHLALQRAAPARGEARRREAQEAQDVEVPRAISQWGE